MISPAFQVLSPVIDQSMNAVLTEIRTELIREDPSKIQQLSQTTSEALKREFLDPVNIFKKIIFDTYLKRINIVLRDVYQKKFFMVMKGGKS